MKFEVRNYYTNAVQFVAEIDCEANASNSIKLGLAVRWAYKTGADLGGADLRSADLRGAYLRGAYLGGADLRGADLRGAYLGSADLRGAYLGGANLGGANLGGADLGGADLRSADLRSAYLGGAYLGEQWVIQGATRSDGYFFILTSLKDEGVRVKAGCRDFSLEEARAHWKATREGTALGAETFAILDCLESMAKARGLL